MKNISEKQISVLSGEENGSNGTEKIRSSSLLSFHANGVVGPLTPEERGEWKRRRDATRQELRAFQRLNDLVRLGGWRRHNGIVIEDHFQALALLIADAMAVVRYRAGKRHRDLTFQNFKFRTKEMGILFPEEVVMDALDEVSLRVERKGRDYRLYSGLAAGRMLQLSHIERVETKAWTITAADICPAEAKALAHERKLAAQSARREAARAAKGCKPRHQYEAESAEKTKPWLALGISRRTWYRRGKPTPINSRSRARNTGARGSNKETRTKRKQVG